MHGLTHTTAVCTVKNSWWWTEELSEACRVLFQKWIWESSASSWFYYKYVVGLAQLHAMRAHGGVEGEPNSFFTFTLGGGE